MTEDELHNMAEKTAAFGVHPSGEYIYSFYTEQLQAFAKLVAEHEREACAGLAERRMLRNNNEDQKIGHHHACKAIAKDIRARGQA
jgi:hypothetical protein